MLFRSVRGLDAATATTLGLRGDEHFFRLPASPSGDDSFGAALQIDLEDATSGLYTLQVEYGIARLVDGKYAGGRMLTQTTPLAVVNSRDSGFGAGWGLSGLLEIFPGDGGVVLSDGNGSEQIFLAPARAGDPFTPLSRDNSVLVQRPDGTFQRTLIDGTVQTFDANDKLASTRDRNGNETRFIWSGSGAEARLDAIADPTGDESLGTRFSYTTETAADGATWRLVREILHPGGRKTRFEYRSGDLVTITDPDGSSQIGRAHV